MAGHVADAQGLRVTSLHGTLAVYAVFNPNPSTLLVHARRMLREADTNGGGKVSREGFHSLFSKSSMP